MVLSVSTNVKTHDQTVVVDALRVDHVRTGRGIDCGETQTRAVGEEEPGYCTRRRRELANDITGIVNAEGGSCASRSGERLHGTAMGKEEGAPVRCCVSPKRRTPSECMTWRTARFGLFR